MASHMITFYKFQTAQVNEESLWESSLNLTLIQHPCDEDPKLQKLCPHLEIEPFRAWYYRISPNFHILMILLKVDLAFDDEPEIVYKGFYKTKYISIFVWFSILVLDTIIGCTV